MKSAKLDFYDPGLLGIEKAAQLATHPLRGAIFENWVIAEIAKYRANRGRVPALYFYRDQRGNEVDLVIEQAARWMAVEIESAATPTAHFCDAVDTFQALARSSSLAPQPRIESLLVYGGAETQQRSTGTLLSWSEVDTYPWFG